MCQEVYKLLTAYVLVLKKLRKPLFHCFLTRQGSGSACRSVYGGFVAWEKGDMANGEDSIAVQVLYIANKYFLGFVFVWTI